MPYKDPEARRAYVLKWYYKHREEVLAREKVARLKPARLARKKRYNTEYREQNNRLKGEWKKRNRHKNNAINQRWRSENRERWLQISRNWRECNKERCRLTKSRRREREMNAVGSCTVEQWLARVEYYGWQCRYCHCSLTSKTVTIDHVIPLARGGSAWPANLVPACASCNKQKRAWPVARYMEWLAEKQKELTQ